MRQWRQHGSVRGAALMASVLAPILDSTQVRKPTFNPLIQGLETNGLLPLKARKRTLNSASPALPPNRHRVFGNITSRSNGPRVLQQYIRRSRTRDWGKRFVICYGTGNR